MRALFALAAALTLAGGLRDAADDWIDATPLPGLSADVSVQVLAQDGTLLRAWPARDGRWRLATPLDQVDPDYIAALIALEDRRFATHPGVDPRAVLRAIWQARHGRVVSGASTLSMQVARLLDGGGTGAWGAKLRQARVALALERRLTKDQVLQLYLDRAPFGGNVEGIGAASRVWFDAPPRRLTPAQVALLVALPQSPEARRPDRHAQTARAARDRALQRMHTAGLLNAADLAAALATPVPVVRRAFPALAPHLSQRLRDADPVAPVIVTTLDADLQRGAEGLARRAVAGLGDRVSVAIMVADHATGAILASVGSPGLTETDRAGFVDMTQTIRSPGSTLKPLIYGLAFDLGLAHPQTIVQDRATTFGTWSPQNFDGRYRGPVRLAEALQASLNIPAVKLTRLLGPARLMAGLDRAGVDAQVPGGVPGLAVALGGVGVTLEGLVQLHAAIARGGRAVTLHALPGVMGPGTTGNGARVMGAAAAWQVGDVLRGAVPPQGAPGGAVAWKTGTSYGHRDAWAIGWDGRHVVGIWLGRPDGTPVPGAFGGDLAAPVMFRVFARLGTVPLPPPPPDTLIVGSAGLPQPLRTLRGDPAPGAVDAPAIAFPPDGALVRLTGGVLTARVREGRAPFTWLANGAPVATGQRDRQMQLTPAGPGPMDLSVIDAEGRAARVRVVVR